MTRCHYPCGGDHHPDGHGKCTGTKGFGGSVELKPGGDFAVAFILGLVVGICWRADIHTHRSGD